jgi:hypothetical protein
LCGFHPGLTKSNLQSFTLWPVVWFRSRPYIQHHLENGLYDVYYVYKQYSVCTIAIEIVVVSIHWNPSERRWHNSLLALER